MRTVRKLGFWHQASRDRTDSADGSRNPGRIRGSGSRTAEVGAVGSRGIEVRGNRSKRELKYSTLAIQVPSQKAIGHSTST